MLPGRVTYTRTSLQMDNLQNQVNARVEAFVAEITELARAAAYQALSAGVDTQSPVAAARRWPFAVARAASARP